MRSATDPVWKFQLKILLYAGIAQSDQSHDLLSSVVGQFQRIVKFYAEISLQDGNQVM